jgi:hypothetical protein
MLMLLSPAKTLIEGAAVPGLGATEPLLLDQTQVLHRTAKARSAKELGKLMGISDKLASLNHQRFQDMSFPHTEDNARQAALTFDGDVYKGLDASTLSPEDLDWAQNRVVMLSGLYGALRPLDLMQPYRLEMGTKLKTRRGPSLYAFWGDRITKHLNGCETDVVVNLASNEYFSAVKAEKLKATLITPVFKDVKVGKARVLSFFAKKARGAMVRWAVQQRVEDSARLRECDAMGYVFQPTLSSDTRWEFHRQQPPPAGA